MFNNVTTLVVDLFPKKSASATAANNLSRCIIGAGGVSVIEPILARIGPGRFEFCLVFVALCFFF